MSTVFKGSYPLSGASVGDIYVNIYKDSLVYLFYNNSDCYMVSREEVTEWLSGGLIILSQ